jgi:BCD family chlorophyll transporter-like MFS transporter
MNRVSQQVMKTWAQLGPRFLPFADVASDHLPLSRLLRLSLIQVSVGMSLVLLVGTLNRVMIVELGVPASIVGIMIALPVLFAPFRALIGYRSDTYKCVLGWKRVPYIYRGTMLQFGGLAIMPFALLVLAGKGHSADDPAWIGQAAAALAFLLVGAGIHTTQTVGLALATDLARPQDRPNVVGLMYVMLLVGSIISSLIFGALLVDFSPGRLVQVIQGSAVVTIVLNGIALWKQEARRRTADIESEPPEPSFAEAWNTYIQGENALRLLVIVGLGTMAFSMQDVLLEPYGGQVLAMTVSETTRLSATLAGGGLLGFAVASYVLSRGADPFQMAGYGALAGIAAFAAVIASASLNAPMLFSFGVLMIGIGGGLFGHGTLTATMNGAPKEQVGLSLGTWGAVQASAAGLAVALGAVVRDLGYHWNPELGVAAGYLTVYAIEILLLLLTLAAMYPLLRSRRTTTNPTAAAVLYRSTPGGPPL